MPALLNEPSSDEASKAILGVAESHLSVLQTELTTAVLDRETYLQKIGALKMLEGVVAQMRREYARRFEV